MKRRGIGREEWRAGRKVVVGSEGDVMEEIGGRIKVCGDAWEW